MNFFLRSSAAQKRYSICETCTELSSLKVCNQCGCFMPFKTKLPWADCPQGFWATSDEINTNDPIPEAPAAQESKEEIIIVP